MEKLKVWVVLKHDDADVIEIEVCNAEVWVRQTRDAGGFWFGPVFILWERINGIEKEN